MSGTIYSHPEAERERIATQIEKVADAIRNGECVAIVAAQYNDRVDILAHEDSSALGLATYLHQIILSQLMLRMSRNT